VFAEQEVTGGTTDWAKFGMTRARNGSRHALVLWTDVVCEILLTTQVSSTEAAQYRATGTPDG
jgi:hypothetical protein